MVLFIVTMVILTKVISNKDSCYKIIILSIMVEWKTSPHCSLLAISIGKTNWLIARFASFEATLSLTNYSYLGAAYIFIYLIPYGRYFQQSVFD